MKRTRMTAEQIMRILRDSERFTVEEACRKREQTNQWLVTRSHPSAFRSTRHR